MNLFLIRRLVWLLLTLAVCGCGGPPDNLRSLTILHVNDLHARLLPDEQGRGGFAQLTTAIKREKAKSEAALVLNAGDLVQGTPVSSIYEGLPCFEIAGHMGFDANVLGNHEFDYTWKRIPDFFAAVSFPTVTANVVRGDGELLAEKPYVILERNGIRVAIIGVLMEGLDRVTKKHQRGPWRLLPVAETVNRYAAELRDRADLIIVLGHLFDNEEEEILETVPDVQVVIGGHNHRGLKRPRVVDGRVGVKLQAYGRELGRLDLTVDLSQKRVASFEWKRIPITVGEFEADPEVQKMVDHWERKVAEVVDVPIGRAERSFDNRQMRVMIEEAMREAVGADFAYMNQGGVRDGLPRGEILIRHVWNVLPFGNSLVYGRVKGSDLPQPLFGRDSIDPNKAYVVVTNDFVADQWLTRYGLDLKQRGPLVREAVIDLIREKRVLR